MCAEVDHGAIAEAVARELRRDSRMAAVAAIAAARRVRTHVVGGFIRDVVLQREGADVDVVAPEAAAFAREFATRVRGTFVRLHEEHEVARVVVRERGEGGAEHVYDFADPRGESIADDLALRDFTLNAVAYELPAPGEDVGVVVDTLGGLGDLRGRVVRAASHSAMQDDPVRVVRAFRFAAELGFHIEARTGELIAEAAQRLPQAAPERVRVELFKMLSAPRAAPLLYQMDELGVLPVLLPELADAKGVVQDERHHLDVWSHALATVEQVEEILAELDRYFPGYARAMRGYLGRGATVAVLKLAALLHDVAKPAVRRQEEDGRLSFAGHMAEGAEIAGSIATRLRLSRHDRQELDGLVRHHRRPLELLDLAQRGELRRRTMARYFRTTGHHSIGLLLLALAYGKAMLGPAQAPDWEASVTQFVQRLLDFYFDEYVPKEKMPRLLTGRDLLEEFSLRAGPELGEMLDAVLDAQMAGQVRTREEALGFVRERLRRSRQREPGA